jgi:hypothetical protein
MPPKVAAAVMPMDPKLEPRNPQMGFSEIVWRHPLTHVSVRLMRELSSAPEGHLFELLVLPGAERRGNQEFAAQLAHSPRSEAEGGTSYSTHSR